VIRFSQESTELLLKAALRLIGIEYPKVHDVGDVLLLNAERFPAKFEARVPQMAEFSKEMASKRSLAMYGVEASGKTPGQIFDDPREAEEALKDAKEILASCLELLKGETGGKAKHRRDRL
jgi:HEPN domain-containing protein